MTVEKTSEKTSEKMSEKTSEKRTGYAVGVFDLLHYGHKNLIQAAMQRCDRLIIGVHTDRFVAEYKRVPTQDQETRRRALLEWSGLPSEDVVCIDDDHLRLVRQFGIQEIYHGNDWEVESYKQQIRYAEGIEALGVQIVMIPYTRGVSTSIITACGIPSLDHKRCFVFDLDNTLMLDRTPMPFARDILLRLEKLGKSVYVVTNNNRYTPESIEERFQQEGLPLAPGHVRSSLHHIDEVLKQHGLQRLYVWGSVEAQAWFRERGYTLDYQVKPDCVVVLYRPHYDSEDLSELCEMVRDHPYLIGNRDAAYPDAQRLLPDTGCLWRFLEYSSGKPPLYVVGKPDLGMLQGILRDYTREETVYVGDSLLTDAELAKAAGVDFVHVDPTQGDIGHVGVLCDMLS